jgi:hypothetical protein
MGLTYVPHPSTGSLFKNDRKTKDHQPDYKGVLCLADGSTLQLAGWVTQGASGKYLSLKLSTQLPPVGDSNE